MKTAEFLFLHQKEPPNFIMLLTRVTEQKLGTGIRSYLFKVFRLSLRREEGREVEMQNKDFETQSLSQ